MNFNLRGVKFIRQYGKPYPRFLAAGWNSVTRDFAVNMAVKWFGIFYFLVCRYLVRNFLYVNQPGVRFLSFVPFLCIQENSVIAISYRKIGHGHMLNLSLHLMLLVNCRMRHQTLLRVLYRLNRIIYLIVCLWLFEDVL
jgi:hypothetical protein